MSFRRILVELRITGHLVGEKLSSGLGGRAVALGFLEMAASNWFLHLLEPAFGLTKE